MLEKFSHGVKMIRGRNNLLKDFQILTEMRLFRGGLLVESRAGARVKFMSLRMRKLKKPLCQRLCRLEF